MKATLTLYLKVFCLPFNLKELNFHTLVYSACSPTDRVTHVIVARKEATWDELQQSFL